jgi:NTP pyrophosphatase (non-canonical NTP hydrolase)
MKEKDYKAFVNYLKNDNLDCSDVVLIHGVFGIAGEAGELIDIVKKHMVYHKPVDVAHVKEELGDLLHYITYLTNKYDWTFEELTEANFQKLKIRYPSGYSDKDAIKRADKEKSK